MSIEKASINTLEGVEELSNIQNLEWKESDEKRVRRAVDFRIMPLVFLLYLLCFVDRTNIGNARIQGLGLDIDISGYRFNVCFYIPAFYIEAFTMWALTIFFISYALIEIPSNLALKKIGARYYLPFLVFGFGLVSMCTAFISSFAGLMICRFFLGVFEGGVIPGISFYLSLFYKRHEVGLRIGIFISGAALSGSFGGLLAAGLSSLPAWGIAARPMHTWRNIFLIEGILTMVIALMSCLLLPNGPGDAKFLTQRDQYIGAERVLREENDSDAQGKDSRLVMQAIFSVNNLIYALIGFCGNVAVQSFSLFLPTILRALGWTALRSQFFSVPPYAVACIWTVLIAYLSDRWKQRGLCLAASITLAIIGYSILIAAHSNAIKYFAVFLAASGAFPFAPLLISWCMNNVSGATNRAVTSAFILTFGYFGAILATWVYRPSDAPAYRQGHAIVLAFMCFAWILSVVGVGYAKWENKNREDGKRQYRLERFNADAPAGLGDRHPAFRYTL